MNSVKKVFLIIVMSALALTTAILGLRLLMTQPESGGPAIVERIFETVRPTGVVSSTAVLPVVASTSTEFVWNYAGQQYRLNLGLSQAVYDFYTRAQKDYVYKGALPANWQEDYYGMFLTPQAGDPTLADLATQLQRIARSRQFSDDQLAELAVTFVQTIPYDFNKDIDSDKPNYPYETLYARLGVCTDKSFLLVAILRQLGFGAAIIDFDKVNHAAVGIACPSADAVFGSGYCYVETTNFFPIGVIPQSFGERGIIDKRFEGYKGQFDDVFNTAVLGPAVFHQRSQGKLYSGVAKIKAKVAQLKVLELAMARDDSKLKGLRAELDAKSAQLTTLNQQLQALKASGDIASYNNQVPIYNQLLASVNALQTSYNMQVGLYNNNVGLYNDMVSNFYGSK